MTGAYPSDWPLIAGLAKAQAGWRCVRCGHPHESPGQRLPCDVGCDPLRHPGGCDDGRQRVLTVHHLDGDKSNCRWWNLAALCQVCHLRIQAKVVLERPWGLFPHSPWFQPYAAGYYAWRYLGLELDRLAVVARLPELLALEGVSHA